MHGQYKRRRFFGSTADEGVASRKRLPLDEQGTRMLRRMAAWNKICPAPLLMLVFFYGNARDRYTSYVIRSASGALSYASTARQSESGGRFII